ncbi:hypothetical protein [Falsiroseomonas oryzae]|uniref:hypothetical protein n=1 Tax=Falsiroseomonas oryzae TaxID=2766473 RepID=UPI0022EB7E21|nr:hypothetical protein [Roseomonas sp. MO-31]
MPLLNATFQPPTAPPNKAPYGRVIMCGVQIVVAGGTNYNWLPWLPGQVSVTAFTENGLITGPMSGCYIVVFKDPAAPATFPVMVAHIGTYNLPDSEQSIAAKTAWAGLKGKIGASNILYSFNPTSKTNLTDAAIAATFTPATAALGAPDFYAAVEKAAPGYNGFTLLCHKNAGLRVSRVENATAENPPF